MIDRRRRPVALCLLLSFVATACLPDAVGPSRSADARPSSSPTASPSPSGPTPVPSFVPPTATPAPPFINYFVIRGDSLDSIARNFDTNADSIGYWNRDRFPSLDPESAAYAPDRIKAGWMLVLIPGAVFDPQALPEP